MEAVLMKIDEKNWKKIKKIFSKALRTTGHFSFATAGKEGIPHAAPIGSLILTDCGKGYYFEEYVSQMAKNFKENDHVCVMAVNGSNFDFLKGLIKGKIEKPLGVRLTGKAGEKREATERELGKFLKLVKPFRWTRGYKILWKDLKYVRDIQFETCEPVRIGAFTSGQEV
jgi:hypothetical protein